jgi:hypothetical protein
MPSPFTSRIEAGKEEHFLFWFFIAHGVVLSCPMDCTWPSMSLKVFIASLNIIGFWIHDDLGT